MYFFLPPRVSEVVETDVLIVGDGIAGMSCALSLAEKGIKPLVIGRGKGNTYLSQGGIAAAVTEDDSPKLHALDTVKAGRLLNDPDAVSCITFDGPRAISKLLEWGVPFDRAEDFFELTVEAAHSRRRIFKVKDYTGKAVYEALHREAEKRGIPVKRGELTELYTDENQRATAALIKTEKDYLVVNFKIAVLATGGAASLYPRSSNISSNPQRVGGDAIGIALRAGVEIRDAEFVQFHPTVLAGTGFLISEAVRGEGAILINSEGKRFVDELAPRDEVSRAIYAQLIEGKRVFLDFRPLIAKGIKIEERFPQIWGILRDNGYNPYEQPIPVEPAAHYFIGGVAVDTFGRTSVENLYAVGECANTGFHGANRLASNSLLEGAVMGLRAADDIAIKLPFKKGKRFVPSTVGQITTPPEGWFENNLTRLKNLLWRGAGIVRNGRDLKETFNRLGFLLQEAEKYFPHPEGRKLFDLLLVARAIVLGALKRKESRGCHFRSDYPKEREPFRSVRYSFTLEDLV